jgi:hypothetical protein
MPTEKTLSWWFQSIGRLEIFALWLRITGNHFNDFGIFLFEPRIAKELILKITRYSDIKPKQFHKLNAVAIILLGFLLLIDFSTYHEGSTNVANWQTQRFMTIHFLFGGTNLLEVPYPSARRCERDLWEVVKDEGSFRFLMQSDFQIWWPS